MENCKDFSSGFAVHGKLKLKDTGVFIKIYEGGKFLVQLEAEGSPIIWSMARNMVRFYK